VHGDLVEALGRDEQVALDALDGTVPGGLDAGGQSVLAGEAHRGRHVLGGGDGDDGGRSDRHREVPRADLGLVLRVVGGVDAPGQLGAQLVVGDAGGDDGGVDGERHGDPPGLVRRSEEPCGRALDRLLRCP
jgi:hypothetical protein